jgi:hypothetical protein
MVPECPRAETRDSLFVDLLQEAVSYLAEDFDNSDGVSGAALVEWFSEWRIRVGQALNSQAGVPDTAD